jgi:hypothetical protein
MKGRELQFLLFFLYRDDQPREILRVKTMRVLRSNLTVPIGATVRCVPRDRPSYGATACAGVFTLWWRWSGTSCASRLWIRLRGLLGLRMDGRSMDPLSSFTHDS